MFMIKNFNKKQKNIIKKNLTKLSPYIQESQAKKIMKKWKLKKTR